MRHVTAKAGVHPVRQETQYTCTAASLAMALQAIGVQCSEKDVNKVLGCRPMRGAGWDATAAAAQHFGARATLVCPSTVEQVKAWTDAGTPVLIGWCPEGRPWGHASVVFDVQDDHTVLVADPNIPDPSEVVRVLSREDFYKKWYEPGGDYLIRRSAMAIEPEIVGGRSRTARVKTANPFRQLLDLLRPTGLKDPGRVAEHVLRAVLNSSMDPARYKSNAAMTVRDETELPLKFDLDDIVMRAVQEDQGSAAKAWAAAAHQRLPSIYALVGRQLAADLKDNARQETFWNRLGILRGQPKKVLVNLHQAGHEASILIKATFPRTASDMMTTKTETLGSGFCTMTQRKYAVDFSWAEKIEPKQTVSEIERKYMPHDLHALVVKHKIPEDPNMGPEKVRRIPDLRQLAAEGIFIGLQHKEKLYQLVAAAHNYYLPIYDRRLVLRTEMNREDPGLRAAALRGYAVWSTLNQAVQIFSDMTTGWKRFPEDKRWLIPLLRKLGYKPGRGAPPMQAEDHRAGQKNLQASLVERIARRYMEKS